MKRLSVLTLGLLAVTAIFAWGWLSDGVSRTPERAISNRPIQIAEDGYASSRACQACHPGQYAAWHASYHRTMTQVATPETVRAFLLFPRISATRCARSHIGKI